MISIFAPSMKKGGKRCFGKEIFVETDEGRIRVLGYNLDIPEKLPLFVNMHGSGFVMGSAEMDDPMMKYFAEKMKVKILSIDYSLAPEYPFPKALDECYAVVKYAKDRPDEFNIDPERIAVGGHSAGGNLTAAICLLEDERRQLGIKCAILDYPPMDIYKEGSAKPCPKGAFPKMLVRMSYTFDPCYCFEKEGRNNPLISPVYADPDALKSFPPALVITASQDSLCAEGEQFKDMLVAAGADVEFKRFDAVHGFNLKRGALAEGSWNMMIDFILKHIGE